MSTERLVHIVHVTPGESSDTVAALTQKLNDGWRLVSSAPMGGAGGNGPAEFASMVILEREDKKTVGGFLG